MESDFFFGCNRNRNGYVFLCRAIADRVRNNDVIAKLVQYEDGPTFRGGHLFGKIAHSVEFDGDEWTDQLAGIFFNRDGKLRTIAANSPDVG